MPLYTVEYTITYNMTVEVEAQSEEDALDLAYDEAINDRGTEHDISYDEFNVIRVEEDDEDDIARQKGDMAYREARDSA